MGFMDFLKDFCDQLAQSKDREVRRVERKYGSRMTDEQRSRAERFHDFAGGVHDWAKKDKRDQ